MNAILELLKKLNPGFEKSTLYKILEYVVLAILLVGLYEDATGSLTNAKKARDEQMKGYAVQLGVQRSELEDLKLDIERLRSWNKSMTERLNSQEKAFRDRQAEALELRINRLEDAAMKRHK
jgi:hypothetical protein